MFLGGVGEIGKNMTALEYGDEIIIVDAGLAFPDEEMPGVDLVIPDTAYLKANFDRVKAFVITHGHEDHIGALPYVLKDFNVPVYATRLTLALLEHKFKEHNLKNLKLNTVKPRNTVKIGRHFSVEFIKVNHSVADSCALAITTPAGVVYHSGDFKVDFTPVDGAMIDLPRIAELGGKGVLLMLCESTNIERPGYTMSEITVGEALDGIFYENRDRRLFIATFASNVHRLQQIIDLAEKYGRKVAFSGRSMLNVADVAAKIGELRYNKDMIVDIEKNGKVEDKKLVVVTTGSQGEPMSALTRMASDDFNHVTIGANDTIVISASAIPGNEKPLYRVINNLYKKGAKVIYEELEKVHVSGHACREEIKLIHSLVRPKFFIPVHGEYRHLKLHSELAVKLGMNEGRILIPEIGMSVLVADGAMRRGDNVPAGSTLVDGLGIGDVGSMVLRDRKHLSEDGLIVVVMVIDKASGEVNGLDVISRGFIYSREGDGAAGIMDDAREIVKNAVAHIDMKNELDDYGILKSNIRKELRNFMRKRLQRTPLILPIVFES
jgi:ribonuclease J